MKRKYVSPELELMTFKLEGEILIGNSIESRPDDGGGGIGGGGTDLPILDGDDDL